MVAPTKVNFKVYQGGTFEEPLRYESGTKAYANITGITKAAPVVITSPSHSIPLGWRCKITNVTGMKEINSEEVYHKITDTDTNSITINTINSLGYTAYVSGGVLEYNVPVPLAGLTARMQIRGKLEDDTVILELTTENGGIVIDDVLKTITINITATATATFTFTSAVYSLELINGSKVTPFIYGTLTLVKEITR